MRVLAATLLLLGGAMTWLVLDRSEPKPAGTTPYGIQQTVLFDGDDLSAMLYTFPSPSAAEFRLHTRQQMGEGFGFRGVEALSAENGDHLVLQVASAFTPDWQVIEGYALQDGVEVGQDTFLGENTALPYAGLVLIKDGIPEITLMSRIGDKPALAARAAREGWTLFQQVCAIIDGEVSTDIQLPGEFERRFLVEFTLDGEPNVGIVNPEGATQIGIQAVYPQRFTNLLA